MSKFKSIKDLKNVVRALVEFANDAVYGQPFEMGYKPNLFPQIRSRDVDLAKMIEPDLEDGDALDKDCGGLPGEIWDPISYFIMENRFPYFTIGIFLGAEIADPTGKATANVRAGWLRANLAKFEYAGLKRRSKIGAKTKRKGRENAAIESIEDLEDIANSLVCFAGEASYGRMFKLDFEPGVFSECDYNEKLQELAARIEPHLKNEPDPTTDTGAKALAIPRELQERLTAIISNTHSAFLTIGMFLGARIADASGNYIQRLGEAWISSILEQPRYSHLRSRPQNAEESRRYLRSCGIEPPSRKRKAGVSKKASSRQIAPTQGTTVAV